MKSFVYYLKQISMNPQKLIKSFIIVLLSMGVMIACKKDEPVEVITDSSTLQKLSQDDGSVGYSVDDVIIDAGQVVIVKDGLKDM